MGVYEPTYNWGSLDKKIGFNPGELLWASVNENGHVKNNLTSFVGYPSMLAAQWVVKVRRPFLFETSHGAVGCNETLMVWMRGCCFYAL